jgi:hypothetical protein
VNLYLLGAAMAFSELGMFIDANRVEQIISEKWVNSAQVNCHAYNSGRSLNLSMREGKST